MTEPSRPVPDAQATEIGVPEQLDPTLPPPGGQIVLPSARKPPAEPEPEFGPPEKPGEIGTIGRYRVLKKVGQGGMGAVYLGFDVRLGRRVALKVLLPSQAADPESRERFVREARAAAMVRSDHVVTIFDVGEERGVPFIAMEYLVGYPLDQYLRATGELPLAQVLRVARETVLGLAAAHELGLIHRDIKPGNVWLEAPHGRVKILDFGLARAQNDETHITTSGLVVGTPAYMSPEQARGLKLDGRSDLFSLGVVFYRLVTGKMPFDGSTTMAILTSLAVDDPVLARRLNPDLPPALEAVINKLLAKKPDDRYQTAWELLAALRDADRPRPVPGELPVVVEAVPMAIAARPENVWEDIEASGSTPRVLSSGTEAATAPLVRSDRMKRPRKSSKVPLVLAGAALLVGTALLAAVLLKLTKEKEKEPVAQSNPINEKRTSPPPVIDPDRKAAEYVLSVGGTVRVNGEGRDIVSAADLPRGAFTLTRANLSANGGATDAGLAALAGCKGPLALFLDRTPITDAGLAHFKGCKTLTVLDLGGTKVTDAGLANFKGCAALDSLSLHQTGITDAGLVHFKDCKALTYIRLSDTGITDAGLGHFRGCKGLVMLNLGGTAVAGAGLEHLKDCQSLRHLDLGGTPGGDEGLEHLKGCKNLKLLTLAGRPVTDAGVAHFKGHKGLEVLHLDRTRITDAALAHLTGCTSLTYLDLSLTGVTEPKIKELGRILWACRIKWTEAIFEPRASPDRAAADHVRALGGYVRVNGEEKDVRAADLRGSFYLMRVSYARNPNLTDDGLAVLKGCTRLTRVALGSTPVGDAGLAHFKGNTTLTRLDLNDTKVTDAGLENLSGCTGLTHLWLSGTKVTDDGLRHLKGCKNLTLVYVNGTDVSETGAAELAKALPGCRVVWNGGTAEANPAADPDRKAAEYALSVGGTVRVEVTGQEREVKDAAELPRGPFALTLLNASRNTKVTDVGLAAVRGCKSLRVLYLNQSPNLTDAGMEHFAGITTLTVFEVYGTAVTDEGLSYFKDCKNLSVLGLGQMPMTDEGLAHFKGCKGLTYLAFSHTPASDAGLELFKGCKGLTHLDVRSTQVTDAGLELCKTFPNLTKLFVQDLYVTPAKIAEIEAAFPNCRIEYDGGTVEPAAQDRAAAEWVISVGGSVRVRGEAGEIKSAERLPRGPLRLAAVILVNRKQVTDADLARFKDCKNLSELNLAFCERVTDAGLANFKNRKDLTNLALGYCKVTDAGLANFKDCKKLQGVALFGCPQVTDAGLANFQGCSELQHLNLGFCAQITDTGLAHFAGCDKLRYLNLHGCAKVTDAGLAEFRGCKGLEYLKLFECAQVTDEGLAPFRDCKGLIELYVQKTKVTVKLVEEFRQTLPKCRIEYDGGVFEPKK
ncbi:MAG: protein kinase [Planctomycetes bacterium]|nr:protein kinase [Planctomycetota bacterium]